MNATIEIDGLRKRFGPTQAPDGMIIPVLYSLPMASTPAIGFLGSLASHGDAEFRLVLHRASSPVE